MGLPDEDLVGDLRLRTSGRAGREPNLTVITTEVPNGVESLKQVIQEKKRA